MTSTTDWLVDDNEVSLTQIRFGLLVYFVSGSCSDVDREPSHLDPERKTEIPRYYVITGQVLLHSTVWWPRICRPLFSSPLQSFPHTFAHTPPELTCPNSPFISWDSELVSHSDVFLDSGLSNTLPLCSSTDVGLS